MPTVSASHVAGAVAVEVRGRNLNIGVLRKAVRFDPQQRASSSIRMTLLFAQSGWLTSGRPTRGTERVCAFAQ